MFLTVSDYVLLAVLLGSDVELAAAEIRFLLGARCLWSARRDVVSVSWSLSDILAGRSVLRPILPGSADGYRFQSIPAALLPSVVSDPGFIASEPQLYPRHYIDMSVGYEGYLANFSSKTRATLARKARKLAKASGGKLDIRSFHRPEQLPAFFAEALPLAQLTYQARLPNASLPGDMLFRHKTKELAKSGNLRAYILYLSGHAIAYLFLPVDSGVLVYAYLGYDQAHAQLSPGTVLQMQALEALFAERRFLYFDFTEGDGPHKALFGTHQADCATVFILRSEVRNHLLLRHHSLFNATVGRAGALAKRIGVKSTLRKLLRPG